MALVYGATECTTYIGEAKYRIHIDQPYEADSDIVKARPDLFRPDPAEVGGVERATAVPGETRKTRKRVAKP